MEVGSCLLPMMKNRRREAAVTDAQMMIGTMPYPLSEGTKYLILLN